MNCIKTIETGGVSNILRVSGATSEWYFGVDYEYGDLYEAEELYKNGNTIKGRKLCLVHYPDGAVYTPLPEKMGNYCEMPVFLDGSIYILNVDFPKGLIQILRFDCARHTIEVHAEIPLSSVKDCYNLSLQVSPLTLTRQSVGDNEFEIVWPEKASFGMGDNESFYLRDGDRLFFSRWNEEGEGADYKYREDTVIKDLKGNVTEVLSGDVILMPNGEIWNVK